MSQVNDELSKILDMFELDIPDDQPEFPDEMKADRETAEQSIRQWAYEQVLGIIGDDIPSDFDHDDWFCQNCDFQPTDGTENCICKIVTRDRRTTI